MKKALFLIALATFSYFNSFGWVKTTIIKSEGGLFGYSSVSESLLGPPASTNCAFTLKCWGVGGSSCSFILYDITTPSLYGCQSIVVNTQGQSWFDVLNDDINDRIVNGYSSGTFVRQDVQITHPVTNNFENAVVVWNYQSSTDILEMVVYSYNEAVSLGIIN